MPASPKHNPRAANLPEVRARDRPRSSRTMQWGCRLRWRWEPKAACRGPSSTVRMGARRTRRVAGPDPARRLSLWQAFPRGRYRGEARAARCRWRLRPPGRVRPRAAALSASVRERSSGACQPGGPLRPARQQGGRRVRMAIRERHWAYPLDMGQPITSQWANPYFFPIAFPIG